MESGIESSLFSEVPGKRDHLYRTGLGGKDFFQIVQGGVRAAVVHKDNLIVIAAAVESLDHSFLKGNDIFRFVIAGDHKGKLHIVHPIS